MQSAIAEWDRERQQWQPASHHTSVTFDARGRATELDQPGAAGSVHRTTFLYDDGGPLTEVTCAAVGAPAHVRSVYSYDSAGRLDRVVEARGGAERTMSVCEYDASGRKKKTEFLPARISEGGTAYGVEGSEMAYGVAGAATLTTLYDERDRPIQAEFHDATGAVLRTVAFTRDSAGRIVTEDARTAPGGGAQFDDMLGHIPAGDRATVAAMLGAAFGSLVTTFTYDSEGRLVERQRRMGTLGEERVTFAYDGRGNCVEERTEHRDREMRMDDEGGMRPTADSVRTDETRFEYTYDREGNWTERVVLARFDPNSGFERTNVEWRTIEYYEN